MPLIDTAMNHFIIGIVILLASCVHLFQIFCISTTTSSSSSHGPPCFFNELCTCSKPTNDLGHVQCSDVPLIVIPEAINQSYVYTLSFQRNGLRNIEARSFWGTGLKGIEISDNKLTSLHDESFLGLENSLRELNLRNNRLTWIPGAALRNLIRLQILNLNRNQINDINPDIDLPENLNSSLRVLLLAGNGLNMISQYAFRNCKSLELLDLSGNNIHTINQVAFNVRPFSISTTSKSSPSGKLLRDANHNPVADVINLKSLFLSNNRLTRVPFEVITNLSYLQVLDLSDNLIANTYDSVVVRRSISLESLNLAGNNIVQLNENAFRNFVFINQLQLSRNPLQTVSPSAFQATEIHQILMDDCELVNISRDAWRGLEAHLHTLQLSRNAIRSDPRNGQIFYNDSFDKLEVLQSFHLKDNSEAFRLSPLSLAASQESMREIEITADPGIMRTPFTPIKYQLQFMNVRRFALSRTVIDRRLTHQDLLGYGGYNLESVDISSAYIEDIAWDSFTSSPSLKHLNLSHNNLRRLDVQVFKPIARTLTVLDLNDGLATSVLNCDVFSYILDSLRTLILSDNGLTTLSSPSTCFAALEHLNLLSLEFNSLRSLDPRLFHHLTSLVYLLLSYNRLSVIESETFKMMDKLAYVDLSYNAIRVIKSNSFVELNVLSEINLEGNEIEIVEKDSFVILPRLERINFAYNRLKTLQLAAFDQIGAMTTLSLEMQGNMINLQATPQDDAYGSAINQRNLFLPPMAVGAGVRTAGANSGTTVAVEPWKPPSSHGSHGITANSVEICDLSHNNITDLNSSYFLALRNTLTHLILDSNRLTRIGFQSVSALSNLQKLSIRSNGLSSLASDAFRNDYSLQIVDLSHNKLIELPSELFLDNSALRILNVAHNELSTLAESLLAKTLKLEIIDLSYNRLSLFPSRTLRHVSSSLRVLKMVGNQLWSLRKDDLEGLFPRLLLLDLSSNNIKQIQTNVFASLNQLTSLDLSMNPIKNLRESIFNGLHDTLNHLNLHECKLTSELPNWTNFKYLQSLNISNNYLTTLSFYNFSHIISLDISGNRLTTVPNNVWHFLPLLRTLHISSNPIGFLHNDSFIGLKWLDHLAIHNLSLNYLQFGVLRPLSSLRKLHVSNYPNVKFFSINRLLADNNGVREVVIHALNSTSIHKSLFTESWTKVSKQLHKLTIDGSIKVLDETFFSHSESRNLQLSIRNTNISQLTPLLFSSLGQTRNLALDIRDNRIQRVSDILLANPAFSKGRRLNLQSFYGSGNQWICDCRLAWLRDWMKQIKREYFDLMVASSVLTIEQHNHNESSSHLEHRYEQVASFLKDLRKAQCSNLRKPLLKAFGEELRECRRGRNSSESLKMAQTYYVLIVISIGLYLQAIVRSNVFS